MGMMKKTTINHKLFPNQDILPLESPRQATKTEQIIPKTNKALHHIGNIENN
jgi:hypothetical protein